MFAFFIKVTAFFSLRALRKPLRSLRLEKISQMSNVVKSNESSLSSGEGWGEVFWHRFSQIKRIKKICESAVKICFFCFSYMPFVVKNFMTVRYLYQTISYERKFSYFVFSTKEKSHNVSNWCDFSFVEMTNLNTLVLVTDSHKKLCELCVKLCILCG